MTTTYRVTISKPGQRQYVGVQAPTSLRAECAAIDAGFCRHGWHVTDVTPEPERPVVLYA